MLSNSEIDNSTYICNGADGKDAEIETEESLSSVGTWYQEGYDTIVTGGWHCKEYESGSKLKLSITQFQGDLNINQNPPYETKPL